MKLMTRAGIVPGNVLYTPNIVSCYRLAASGMGITFATPYATRYTFPGQVPVIAKLSTEDTYEHNAIAYLEDKELSTVERRFIAISIEKLANHPMLQPLDKAKWERIKKTGPDCGEYFFV